MADLSELQSAGTTKIVGSDATGAEQTAVNSTTNGGLHTNLRDNAGTEFGTSTNPIRNDPTGTTTQPVSVASLPLPSGASTSANQTTEIGLLGALTETAPANDTASSGLNGRLQRISQRITSLIALIPSINTTAFFARLSDGTNNVAVKAASTAAAAADPSLVVSVSPNSPLPVGSNTIGSVTQSGTWNLGNITGTVSLPTGAATSANQVTELASLALLDDVPTAQNGAFVKGTAIMGQLDDTSTTAATEDAVAAARITPQRALHSNLRNQAGTEIGTVANPINDTNPTIATNGATKPTQSALIAGSDGTNIYPLLTDNQGRLVTSAITGYNANFSFGDITTAAITQVPVRRTAYIEQTVNAQRSIASASASDAAAGTGARQVIITYFDQTGAGPFTETVTLNGTTGVNTTNTNICYIEKIVVSSVGSGGLNAGIISLYAAVSKGGVVIGTIAASDNQTLWCHHYVATGKTCNITGFSNSHSGTTVGSGGVFVLKSKTINSATAPEIQVSDFNRLYGQDSANPRNYGSPIKVVGPARVIAYVSPETATSTIYRAAIDFFEP